jgi:hypothetical protein
LGRAGFFPAMFWNTKCRYYGQWFGLLRYEVPFITATKLRICVRKSNGGAALRDHFARKRNRSDARSAFAFRFVARMPVDSEIVAMDRNQTIYCLEPETRQALFLEMPHQNAQ